LGKHIAYDLIYNPANAISKRQTTGHKLKWLDMLIFQAESLEDLE
jgi:hypothetical protein